MYQTSIPILSYTRIYDIWIAIVYKHYTKYLYDSLEHFVKQKEKKAEKGTSGFTVGHIRSYMKAK